MTLSLDLTADATRDALRARVAAPVKESLIGLTRDELAEALVAAGIVPERQAKMRVQQLWHWLYVRGVSDFADMFNISKDLRAELDRHFTIARPEIVEEQISTDGTRKWLFRFPPRGAGRPVEIETVYIPEEGRGTLCISSPGRLHADLLVLPHRHAEAGAQPDGGRNPRAAADGARPARRFPRPRHARRRHRARPKAARSPTSS